jgi:WD40 repeat protein
MNATIQSGQLPDLPYPGIEPFNYAWRKVFFAREKEARTLMQLIGMYRGVLLYSDSGTGKSSLVNAGLIPLSIDRGFQPERIRVQPRKGEEIIVERLSEKVDGKPPFLPSIFASDEQQERVVLSVEEFKRMLRQPELDVRSLLIFDQFEEWITLFEEGFRGGRAEETRTVQKSIRKSIVSLINDKKLRVKTLIVLREDYLAKLDPLFEQCRSLPDQYLRLTALSGDQIYRVIRGPFEPDESKSSVAYETQITKSLAQKIRQQFEERSEGTDVRLTEVQIVCRSLFEAGISGQKIDQYFTDEGGVQGILEQYLKRALGSLNTDQQEPAVALLTRMLTSYGTRNVISEDNLLDRVENEDGIQRELLGKTLQSLEQEAKLVRRERRREVYYYEIASEFLVGWIRRKALERQQLVERRKLEEARRVEEQARQARRAKLFRLLSGALFIMLLVVIMAAIIAFLNRRETKKQAWIAHAHQLAAQAMLTRIQQANLLQVSLLLAVESMKRYPSLGADQALRQGLALLPHAVACLEHESEVKVVAFSPYGNYLATASEPNTAQVWEVSSGKKVASMGHEWWVDSAVFSQDGKYLVTISSGKTTRVWEATSSTKVDDILHDEGVSSVVLSPDGKYLATASQDGTVRVSEVTSGQEVASPMKHKDNRIDLVFSPNGKYLVTVNGDKAIRVWDANSGQEVNSVNLEDSITGVAVSSDGKYLATASTDNTARVWEVTSSQEVASTMKHDEYITDLVFSPDGKYLATASQDGTARVWEVTSGQEVKRVIHENSVYSVAFSHDREYLATASQDKTARLWETTSGEEVARMEHEKKVHVAVFSPDGKYLATASDPNTARVWEVTSGQEVQRVNHENSVSSVVFSPDGKYLATASTDNTARVWEVTSGQEVQCVKHENRVRFVAFSPDGKYLATASDPNTAQVWEVPSGRVVVCMNHNGFVYSVAFSPYGKYLATASDDRTARVWEVPSGREVALMNHEESVYSLAFSPDAKFLATASLDGTARVWEANSGQEVKHVSHKKSVDFVTFSPYGKFLATASRDGTARVWEVTSGREMARMNHEAFVSSVDFSQDGKYLATVSDDGAAHIWFWRPKELIEEAYSRLTRNLTYGEWKFYFPDEPYRKTCPNLPIHSSVFNRGEYLAKAGDIEGAVRIFRRVLKLEPGLELDPETKARQLAARAQISKGKYHAVENRVSEAVAAYEEARKLSKGEISAEDWNYLGWEGSLRGDAAKVLHACDRAVELEPENGRYHDTRGIARALTGDYPGAIKDFQFYIEWKRDKKRPELIKKRQDWIQELNNKQNPFDPNVLEALREEEI